MAYQYLWHLVKQIVTIVAAVISEVGALSVDRRI